MKYSRFLLMFSILAATPAFAASVVMVQFGSFETQDEANKRLAEVKGSNAAALGSLPTGIREVKLPPDNLTVYRTQAGPLASRSDANALCSKLAANGSECYVVETAVSQNTAPTTTAAPTKTAEATIPPAPAPVNASTAAPGALSAGTATPDAKALNNASTSNSSSLNSVHIPEITRSSANVTTTPVVNSTAAGTGASPQMQAAMDKAVAAQNSGTIAADNATATAAEPVQKRSFWSHLNPFSSDPKPAPKAAVAAAAPLPTAAPVEPVSSAAIPAAMASGVALAPLSAPASTIKSTPVEQPVQTAALTPENAIVLPSSSTQVASNSARPQLLPPPAPLTAQDKKDLETASARPAPEMLAAPIASTPAPVAKSTPIIAPQAIAPAANGNVQVEEAKRVPLTETVQAPLPAVAAVPVAPAVNLLPSSTTGQKTLWAQIGQFNNSDEALVFWDTYRQLHPDFPVVRVRIASSLQQQAHGNERVWLRVGPFARDGFINSLCSSLANNENPQIQSKKCGVITDMGIAAKANATAPGYLSGSRYKR